MRDSEARFWAKVDKNGPVPKYRPHLGACWLWTACVNAKGYGQMAVRQGSTLAHRISFALSGGIVSDGMQIDHLCRVRGCVNPKHLEVVTPRTNTRRGYSPSGMHARKTYCVHGHPLSGYNLRITERQRFCRACVREAQRRYQARKRRHQLETNH